MVKLVLVKKNSKCSCKSNNFHSYLKRTYFNYNYNFSNVLLTPCSFSRFYLWDVSRFSDSLCVDFGVLNFGLPSLSHEELFSLLLCAGLLPSVTIVSDSQSGFISSFCFCNVIIRH